jgi:hypothetical protein
MWCGLDVVVWCDVVCAHAPHNSTAAGRGHQEGRAGIAIVSPEQQRPRVDFPLENYSRVDQVGARPTR